MKLSTKGRYGLKAMFELALYYGKGPLSIKDIADKQDLSENYLEQLISTLKKRGLVKSIRGAQGGYLLTKPPKEITVGVVIRALEGEIKISDCIADEDNACERESFCVTKNVWIKIRDSINDTIDNITLEDMVNEYEDIQ
ncbi:Rrf2 family transcriptional regulator [Clostridiaceae bacterium M8S5]|nr:Rrf2 family transcriptional regulator [Clostridiaceae bacterium M8S5]